MRRGGAAVLLGVVTSVAVAWGLALAVGEKLGAPSRAIGLVTPTALLSLNESAEIGRRFRSIWYIEQASKKDLASPEGVLARWESVRGAGPQHGWPDTWLSWGGLDRDQLELVRRRQSAFGFPVVCMWYERSGGMSMFGSAMRVHGGYEVASKRSGFVAEAALPLRPIWFGLAMNSAAYGAGWWGVLALVGRWRRRRAELSGRCPTCRYDLAGLPASAPCPECGRERS